MKIAITTTGEDLSAMTDPRFGRSMGFIIFDTETKDFTYLSNKFNAESLQGAGIQSAKNVIDAGAEVLITGNVGPKAFTTLQAASVETYLSMDSTVKDSIDAYTMGELEMTSDANVSGHWVGGK